MTIQFDLMRWADKAACKGKPAEWFFLDRGGHSAMKSKRAKSICAECPVRDECLDYAIRHSEQEGIWGGMTYPERKKVWRERYKEVAS